VKEVFDANRSRSKMYIRLMDDPHRSGKKRALTFGNKLAQDGLVVTTDGDCVMGKNWLKCMAGCYTDGKPQLILGPVSFHREKGWFGRMQSLEFAGLQVVTGGSAALGRPLLCNGANLAYPKHVFEEVGGYSDDRIASGDDMFLLQKIRARYPDGVRFLKAPEAMVYTCPQENVSAFLSQRQRWASKFNAYSGMEIKATAVLVFLCNLFFLLGPAFILLFPSFLPVYLILAGGKLIIDFLFLFLAISFTQRRHLLWIYLPEQLIYSMYVVISACLAFRKGFEWKGRRVDK
jgi:biofilm PGA synthesis N-glycosyltransferase PgaC